MVLSTVTSPLTRCALTGTGGLDDAGVRASVMYNRLIAAVKQGSPWPVANGAMPRRAPRLAALAAVGVADLRAGRRDQDRPERQFQAAGQNRALDGSCCRSFGTCCSSFSCRAGSSASRCPMIYLGPRPGPSSSRRGRDGGRGPLHAPAGLRHGWLRLSFGWARSPPGYGPPPGTGHPPSAWVRRRRLGGYGAPLGARVWAPAGLSAAGPGIPPRPGRNPDAAMAPGPSGRPPPVSMARVGSPAPILNGRASRRATGCRPSG